MEARRMDEINKKAWADRASVDWFASLEGYTDAGERAAIERVAAEMRDQPILDIGVGAGRTLPLLRAISRDYVAIDYTPELVDACQKKHPDAVVMRGDARDLSAFPDASFALVVFSFNGIDAVNQEDRMKVLKEAHRVLRPGGVFLFSVHNRLGPGHGERLTFGVWKTRNPFKMAFRVLKATAGAPLTIYNYLRFLRMREENSEYSIRNASAHNHGIVIYYIDLEAQRRQLESAGFVADAEAYDNVTGDVVAKGADTSKVWWFHLLARKPGKAAGKSNVTSVKAVTDRQRLAD